MAINPILHQLGFVDGERALLLHAEDLGMCQATLQAFAELVECGLICSGSVMVPCPSFPQIAAYCRAHHRIDMGVHLTLTSEFDSYRWGPVSTSDPASGLLDNEGYFPRWPERLHGAASPAAIELELVTQIRQALRAGIDVTHLDLHMGCLMHPDLLPLYLPSGLRDPPASSGVASHALAPMGIRCRHGRRGNPAYRTLPTPRAASLRSPGRAASGHTPGTPGPSRTCVRHPRAGLDSALFPSGRRHLGTSRYHTRLAKPGGRL
jgi:hypothetical protein